MADSPKPAGKSAAEWQDQALSRILHVTLEEGNPKRPGRLYLADLAQELRAAQPVPAPLLITEDRIDEVILARLTFLANKDRSRPQDPVYPDLHLNAFDYLLECWKRCQEIAQNMAQRGAATLEPATLQARLATLDKCADLLVSYAGITITMPDMFVDCGFSEIPVIESLVNRLLREDPTSASGIPTAFWEKVSRRFDGDGLDDLVDAVVAELGKQLAKVTIFDDFRSHLRALAELTGHPALARALTAAPSWLGPAEGPAPEAPQLASTTLLGPFFNLSGFPREVPQVITTYFADLSHQDTASTQAAVTTLRSTVDYVFEALFQITNTLIRAGTGPRAQVLQYVAHVVQVNRGRAKMQVDPRTVSGDGFLLNWAVVLLRLCEPFMTGRLTKLDRIDPYYFAFTDLLDVREATRLRASEPDAAAYLERQRTEHPDAAPPNFISDAFYLTFAVLHLSLIPNFAAIERLARDIPRLREHLDQLRSQRAGWQGTPAAMMNERVLQRHSAEYDRLRAVLIATEAQAFNPAVLALGAQFYTLAMTWLLRLADPATAYPASPLTFPLPEEPPTSLACLPEYFVEDATEFYLALLRYDPSLVPAAGLETLVTFLVVFLRQAAYLQNPYLRAKLVEVLYYMTLDQQRGYSDAALTLTATPVALEHLAPALLRFYVEVERTGASSQFYDKFNIRYHIAQVLKFIRQHPSHKAQIQRFCRESDVAVRCVNLLMNDTTYLLDESLSTLTEIRNIQNEMGDAEAWAARDETHRQERAAQLAEGERKAGSYMALANETVALLRFLTQEAPWPFLTPEIVERLAAMLNYNLQTMVGPRCTELKVRDPERYRFQPRVLLSHLIDVYLCLADDAGFVRAVAADERSYSRAWFDKAARILDRFGLKSPTDLDKLHAFVDRVEAAAQEHQRVDEGIEDIPDEFLDPVMFTPMTDPVILPSSRVTIDRSTIKSHLLSDGTDPFNRHPLKIEDVIPNDELRERIQKYRESKQQ
ncbi:Ubiquitin conjugation factor E4 [Tieghemiomyces parasiticus]|uniref:RING-type E3 ubiquitin transferase n=1 Tax=Tieghemiomyces parasiticus TaxID=78921 RepID=A0A9W8ADR0_9FUNG|nr:Ubiquitin conjugation factor E4 [Tieghemiomyces parasiticus]